MLAVWFGSCSLIEITASYRMKLKFEEVQEDKIKGKYVKTNIFKMADVGSLT